MTPTDELVASIVNELVKSKLIPARAVGDLSKKLASGGMKAEDWRNLAVFSDSTQERTQ